MVHCRRVKKTGKIFCQTNWNFLLYRYLPVFTGPDRSSPPEPVPNRFHARRPALGCPRLPQAAPGCPKLPQAAPGCPRLPQAAPGCPRPEQPPGSLQGASGSLQRPPGGCPRLPQAAPGPSSLQRASREHPGASRSLQGASRSFQEPPGSLQEPPEASRSFRELPGGQTNRKFLLLPAGKTPCC